MTDDPESDAVAHAAWKLHGGHRLQHVSHRASDDLHQAVMAAIMGERERCLMVAKDWFTLPPKERTKARLLKALNSEQEHA